MACVTQLIAKVAREGAFAEWGVLVKQVVPLGSRGTTGQLHGSMIPILYRELLLKRFYAREQGEHSVIRNSITQLKAGGNH